MAQKIINIGVSPNDGTGDTLRFGGDKINDNFTEIYPLLNNRVQINPVPIDWSMPVNQQIRDHINSVGLFVPKDVIKLLVAYKPTSAPGLSFSFSPHYYLWTAGEGGFGTALGNTWNGFTWIFLSATHDDQSTQYPLGEIGLTPIEDVVNGSGPYIVSTSEPTLFVTTRSGVDHVYLYIGNADIVGLGETQTTAADFVDLNEEPVPPIDPNDYVTNFKFDSSLYDTATTGFSTDLSNFTSLTEKFYVLMIDDGTNPVTYYFASKETNTEDFDGSRIYISASGTKHDLNAPTVTQNGYHFWDLGDLGVVINPSTGDWSFQAWFDTMTDNLQRVTYKGNTTSHTIIQKGGVGGGFEVQNANGDVLARMFQNGNQASGLEIIHRDGTGNVTSSALYQGDWIDVLNMGRFFYPDKLGVDDVFAMISDLVAYALDANVLHNTGDPTMVALKDDTGIEAVIFKEFDEGITAYATTAELIAGGYTTVNGYVQGFELVMRNTGTYTRYEKMSDDDNDWYFFVNANGWQPLPLV